MTKRILVVDDSTVSRMIIKAIINGHIPDVDIIEADCGEQALTMVKADSSIDLAFIDFNMPGMSGLELIKKIANILIIPKVALLTANYQDELKVQAENAGVSFLHKPINEAVVAGFLHQ